MPSDVYAPSGAYRPFRRAGQLLFVSGHGPRKADGQYLTGCLASAGDVAAGYAAAQLATLNLLAAVKLAIGDLSKVEAVVKVLGLVNSTHDFKLHPKVIDGCSDTLIQAFGERGEHARSAVGMASLPHGMMVEIEAIFLISD
ncbi:Enamine deaminase RidA, house cleaning of reactive enamine intermediates, YjgF/YER057c/UK114 family [Variovorax sp. CF079]|nr:Enamine deaminase RidA, house cleaning of reactive enamine intermediates, YjgF/YER057c/UK114 family [Variovorax sp. CF079]